jgi:hypothetical protein
MSRTTASPSLAIAFGATGGSFSARADSVVPGTCDGFGAVTFSPAHPILTDVISVRIGSAPLYRLRNGRADSNHRYMASARTREAMIAKSWVSEGHGPDGASMCAPLQ